MMHKDYNVMGWSKTRKTITAICNDEGLDLLPPGEVLYRDGGGGWPIALQMDNTKANLVALRMMNAISEADVAVLKEYAT